MHKIVRIVYQLGRTADELAACFLDDDTLIFCIASPASLKLLLAEVVTHHVDLEREELSRSLREVFACFGEITVRG